jgi:hypothetical protein
LLGGARLRVGGVLGGGAVMIEAVSDGVTALVDVEQLLRRVLND